MSATILVNEKAKEVGIVQWIKDPKFSGGFPSGPLVRMSIAEFKERGFESVRRACEDYERIQLAESEAVPVFAPDEEKSYLKNSKPISVFRDHLGQFVFVPRRFRKYTLGGMVSEGPDSFKKVSWKCTPNEFLATFEAALSEC